MRGAETARQRFGPRPIRFQPRRDVSRGAVRENISDSCRTSTGLGLKRQVLELKQVALRHWPNYLPLSLGIHRLPELRAVQPPRRTQVTERLKMRFRSNL